MFLRPPVLKYLALRSQAIRVKNLSALHFQLFLRLGSNLGSKVESGGKEHDVVWGGACSRPTTAAVWQLAQLRCPFANIRAHIYEGMRDLAEEDED